MAGIKEGTAKARAIVRSRRYGGFLILLLAMPAQAHCYSIWHYRTPQKCFTALAPMPPQHRSRTVPKEQIDIPMPSLDFQVCPEGDEKLWGIAFSLALREALQAEFHLELH